jgi:hypothetical protein
VIFQIIGYGNQKWTLVNSSERNVDVILAKLNWILIEFKVFMGFLNITMQKYYNYIFLDVFLLPS